jgi:hypothetical protein
MSCATTDNNLASSMGARIATSAESFATGTHAIETDNLDIDIDGAEELVDPTGLGVPPWRLAHGP